MRTLVYLVVVVAGVARAEVKLGYVDLQRALSEVHEGKEAKGRLKAELDSTKAAITLEQNKLQSERAVLEKQAAMMSEDVRAQKFSEWQRRLIEVTQKAEKKQLELAEKERTELKKIFDRMDPIIRGIAEREQLTMVFEKTDSGLVYAPATMDLTAELVRTYNDKYPATKPAPKAARPP